MNMTIWSKRWDHRMVRIPDDAPTLFWVDVEKIEVGSQATEDQLLALDELIRRHQIRLRVFPND